MRLCVCACVRVRFARVLKLRACDFMVNIVSIITLFFTFPAATGWHYLSSYHGAVNLGMQCGAALLWIFWRKKQICSREFAQ